MMNNRNSTMELLRIFAMLLVMITHASFLSFGVPTQSDILNRPFYSFNVFFFQGISIVCVNVFILLSGWFSISWKSSRITNLLFQVFFFSSLIMLFLYLFGQDRTINVHSLRSLFFLNSSDYWFFKAYLGLYIISPIINIFFKYSPQRQVGQILLIFFCFQTIYGWLSLYGAQWLEGGYSAFSFIGLYLLAKYIKIYPNAITNKKAKYYILFYLISAFLLAILSITLVSNGYNIVGRLYTYTNPLIISMSVSLLLFFAKLKSTCNKLINWIASSCFSVYLLHANELVLRPYFGKHIYNIYQYHSGVFFVSNLLFFLFSLFAVAILLDKIRLWLWNKIVC